LQCVAKCDVHSIVHESLFEYMQGFFECEPYVGWFECVWGSFECIQGFLECMIGLVRVSVRLI